VDNNMDLIAASFTRNAECVREIKALLGEQGKLIQIICKIENQEGLDNFDEILKECEGIMVARGDLGVEIPIQKVCMAQKMMIRKCNLAGKPVITATQMLESMVENPRPTRAEATDVANAVFDGTDCVMLSGETAKGKYPFEACSTMARICRSAEAAMDYSSAFQTMALFTQKPLSRAEVVASGAVRAATDLSVGCIVVLTETGSTSRWVAKYRPPVPINSNKPKEKISRHGKYVRGLWPLCVERESEANLVAKAVEFARVRGWIPAEQGKGQIVLVSGMNIGQAGGTNMMKVLDV
jgi:pyruvate kinase